MDSRVFFGALEAVVGALIASMGAWQYVVAAPLPGPLGRSLRPGQKLEALPPRRWQLSGAAQGLVGLGLVFFGAALLLQGQVDEAGLGAIRTGGIVAWLVAVGLIVVVFRRYRSES